MVRAEACVVHEDVQPAGPLNGLMYRSLDRRSVPEVQLHGVATASVRANLFDDGLGVVDGSSGRDHRRARVGEREDEVAPDAPTRAGHERHLSVHVESRELHHALILSPDGSQRGSSTTSASTHSPKTSIESFVPTSVSAVGRYANAMLFPTE